LASKGIKNDLTEEFNQFGIDEEEKREGRVWERGLNSLIINYKLLN
jgi:hypothetical protein